MAHRSHARVVSSKYTIITTIVVSCARFCVLQENFWNGIEIGIDDYRFCSFSLSLAEAYLEQNLEQCKYLRRVRELSSWWVSRMVCSEATPLKFFPSEFQMMSISLYSLSMTAKRFSNDISIWSKLNEKLPKDTGKTHFDNSFFYPCKYYILYLEKEKYKW